MQSISNGASFELKRIMQSAGWNGYTGRRTPEGVLPDGPTNCGRLNSSPEKMGMTFLIYKDKGKEWRWTLRAKNGRKIADGGEGYKRKSQVVKMIGKIVMGPHRIIE
jgi:uncharacterized protein YegP (UPF0339 family)